MNPDTASNLSDAPSKELVRKTRPAPFTEAGVWQTAPQGWRLLYGSFYDLGVSVEWHDFQMDAPFDWSRSFHPGSIELCLNLSGHGAIRCGDKALHLDPLTAGFYLPGKNALHAARSTSERHCFVTLEFSSRFLRRYLSSSDGALHPLVERFLRGNPARGGLGQSHRLTSEQEQLIARLVHPPVFQAARGLWYQSKVLQLMAEFFFERRQSDELLCDRQKQLARARVDRVRAILAGRLAEPPGLDEIGREVGCSPFYLSRTFSQEMGMTIPQYLRKIRMERAGELLRSGRYNVTEAALEVGYSSLSHFSQAFCQSMGCCPGLFH